MTEIRIPVSKPTPQTIAGTNHIIYPPEYTKMNMRTVKIKVDIDTVRGLRARMKHMGWNNCDNNDCGKMIMAPADDAVLDMVKEFMDDFIAADFREGRDA